MKKRKKKEPIVRVNGLTLEEYIKTPVLKEIEWEEFYIYSRGYAATHDIYPDKRYRSE